MKKTLEDVKKIVRYIRYKNWKFIVGTENSFGTEDLFLQIKFTARDTVTGFLEEQSCRKWRLSPFMTETEIVRTAWKAVIAAEEHEAGENFIYCNSTPFNPHTSIGALIHASENIDKRETPDAISADSLVLESGTQRTSL